MSREEAIETLKANYPDACYEQLRRAVDASIEALKAQTDWDAISRRATIDIFTSMPTIDGLGLQPLITVADVVDTLEKIPSAQPDLSDYSDKLWKAAYERGKREAQTEIIHCRECIYCGSEPIADGRHWCKIHGCYMYYCSDAERKQDET